MKPRYWITLLALGAGWLGFWLLTGEASLDSLTNKALHGADSTEKGQAAAALGMHKGSRSTQQLRKVVAESNDTEVKIAALNGLVSRGDFDSAALFLDAMESPDKTMRQLGLQGMKRTIGLEAPDYRVDDAPESRAKAVKRLREVHKVMLIKAANPDLNDDPSAGPVTSPTAPAPHRDQAAATSAPPSRYSAMPGEPRGLPYDFRLVKLVIWLCRGVALLLLVMEIIGAACLVQGLRDTRASGKRGGRGKAPLTLEEQMDKLVERVSPSLWSKIGLLASGAVCIVGLLWAGEVVGLAAQFLGEPGNLGLR